MSFNWNEEKNALLKADRGISFERIVVAVEEGHLLDILDHPNAKRYKNQRILIVDIDGYAICVPFVEEADGDFFLKTIFPSRKYTKLFNLEEENEFD